MWPYGLHGVTIDYSLDNTLRMFITKRTLILFMPLNLYKSKK